MENLDSPDRGGVSEEQIGAFRDEWHRADREGDSGNRVRRALRAALSASASANQAECRCSAYSEDRGGGYFELMPEPEPDCPDHGNRLLACEVPAKTVDNWCNCDSAPGSATCKRWCKSRRGATAAQDRENLITEARRALRRCSFADGADHSVLHDALDSLDAPVGADEAKLAGIIKKVYYNSRTRHGAFSAPADEAARAIAEYLRGGGND